MKQAKKIWNGVNVKIRDFLASLCFSGPSFLGMLIFFVAPFCVVIYYRSSPVRWITALSA